MLAFRAYGVAVHLGRGRDQRGINTEVGGAASGRPARQMRPAAALSAKEMPTSHSMQTIEAKPISSRIERPRPTVYSLHASAGGVEIIRDRKTSHLGRIIDTYA